VARYAEIHAVRREDQTVRMEPLPALNLPHSQELTLAPGRLHIMLVGLAGPLYEGDSFDVTLRFAQAGERVFEVEVRTDVP
jgi:copper(I)-binding protein